MLTFAIALLRHCWYAQAMITAVCWLPPLRLLRRYLCDYQLFSRHYADFADAALATAATIDDMMPRYDTPFFAFDRYAIDASWCHFAGLTPHYLPPHFRWYATFRCYAAPLIPDTLLLFIDIAAYWYFAIAAFFITLSPDYADAAILMRWYWWCRRHFRLIIYADYDSPWLFSFFIDADADADITLPIEMIFMISGFALAALMLIRLPITPCRFRWRDNIDMSAAELIRRCLHYASHLAPPAIYFLTSCHFFCCHLRFIDIFIY